MGKYSRVALTSWQRAMVYRWNTALEVVGYLATTIISISLWQFIFAKTGGQSIRGYTPQEMVNYLIVSGYLANAFWFTAQGNRIMNDIKDGVISNYLAKPMGILKYYLSYGLTGKAFQIMMSTIGLVGLLVVFGIAGIPFAIHSDLFHVAFFIVLFVLAALIQFFIFSSTSLLAFWMEEVWGISFVVRVFADIAAGAFLPLTFFSVSWQHFFNFLPFRYIISVPANVLLMRLDIQQSLVAIISSFAWMCTFYFCSLLLLRRGVRHYSAVGG